MKSVVFWLRPSRKLEVELSLDQDALRIYRSPNSGSNGNFSKFRRSTSPFDDDGDNDDRGFANSIDLLATIYFPNIVGTHRMKGRSSDDRTSYFTVYAYPRHGGFNDNDNSIEPSNLLIDRIDNPAANSSSSRTPLTNGGGAVTTVVNKKIGKRYRQCYTFQIEGKFVYEDNAEHARSWIHAIQSKIVSAQPVHLQKWLMGNGADCPRRRLYVLVNPHSGPGRALKIFQDDVMPVLAEANIACRVIVTEKANQAHELMRSLHLDEWDGVVIVSGDGLVYEVINGLAGRADRDRALKIPIGAIPGGSGNALAAAACFPPGESIKGTFAVDAAVAVARPIYRPMRLVRVEMGGRQMWSFLSVGWGLLSDIDIESEKFRRPLGSARFTAGALIRLLNLRKYRARISYVPATESTSTSSSSALAVRSEAVQLRNGSDSESKKNHMNRSSTVESSEFSASRIGTVPRAKSMCPSSSNSAVLEENGEPGLIAATPSTDTSPFQVRFDLDSPHDQPDGDDNGTNEDDRCTAEDLVRMPRLDEPVPSDWKVIEDDLILFYAVYLDRIGAEAPYSPACRLDDEYMHLTFIRAGSVTKTQLAKFLFAIERAEHTKMPFFEDIPVKAFRLERLSSGPSDIVAVDGELISGASGPIQACVTNYTATIMTSNSTNIPQNGLTAKL